MMPAHKLIKPADGSPITLPNKEMALGTFYLTSINEENRKKEIPVFSDIKEVLLAHALSKIELREPIRVRINNEIIETTCGRLLFNEQLPKVIGFVNEPVKASTIKRIITKAITECDPQEVVRL